MSAQKSLPKSALPLSIMAGILVLTASLTALLWDGLYANEVVAYAAEAIGQDLVNVVWVIPLYAVALYFLQRGSLRARLAWIGLLFYFVYTYIAYALTIHHNEMFLVYVAAYSLSLALLIMGVSSLKVENLPEQFTEKLPRYGIGIFGIVVGIFLIFLWGSTVVTSLISGELPVELSQAATQSLGIWALDMGLIAPLGIVGGISIIRNKPLGYLLSGIMMIKVISLGTALIAMVFFEYRSGTVTGVPITAVFPFILIGPGAYLALRYFRSIKRVDAAAG